MGCGVTRHPALGRRVRFFVPQYGVNVSGTVVKVDGHTLTVSNVLPRVPGQDTLTINETCVLHVKED